MRTTSAIGTLRIEDGRGVVRMEDTFATGIADLWAALTEPDRLARWVAEVDGDPRLGATLTARFTSGWEGMIRVDECEPERRILLTSGVGTDDPTTIEATLEPDGARTHLVIEERGFPPADVATYGAGWQVHIEDLGTRLSGGEPAPWVDRVRQLAPEYAARTPEQSA